MSRWGLGLVLLLGAAAQSLAAQSTRLTLGGFTGAFGNSTVANFTAGNDLAGSNITFTVRNTAGADNRRTTVFIAATATTIGTKPISSVEWSLDQITWFPLSTTPTQVATRTIAGVNTQWVGNVRLRILYPWVGTPNQALAATVVFTLRVDPP